ncbi:MAG: sensor histidine kinase [Acidimicrobiales bacterium]
MNEACSSPPTTGLIPIADGTRARIGRAMAGTAMIVSVVGCFVVVALGRLSFLVDDGVVHLTVSAVGFGALAWVMLAVQPRNGAVWALAWTAVFAALTIVGQATRSLEARELAEVGDIDLLTPADFPLVSAIGLWLGSFGFLPFFLPVTLGVLLFPDGRLPSPRWRWVGWGSVAAMAVMVLPIIWVVHPTSDYTYGYAAGSTQPEFVDLLVLVGYLSSAAFGFVCLASLIARYRRTDLDSRRQIRLAVFGFIGFMFGATGSAIVDAATGSGLNNADAVLLDRVFLLAGVVILVGSFALAILKFRLYDLDVVISKTFTSLLLAAFISIVYIGLVVGVGEVLGGRSSFVLSIAVTTVVAITFQPVRRVVQAAANRLVYGARASPYEVLAQFGRRSAELADEELIGRVPRLVVDGTSAARATLWVESNGSFDEGPSWPESPGGLRSTTATADGPIPFADPEADRSYPIVHDGQLLGGISIGEARGEKTSASDDQVVAGLASALGLAMRNARLTSRLRIRLAEMEASRERVLAATDDARRSLELDLDRGPQQQLQTVEVGLGQARELALADGIDSIATMVAGLEDGVANARSSLRDFARGVYPPLLEAKGLAAAIADQVETTPLSVTVSDGGLERYSQEIEAAVYFTVLEALQNTTKHAGADSASVTLGDSGGSLTFQVSDDGCGFDVASMGNGTGLGGLADRLETVGGRVELRSAPGQGTTVRGLVTVSSQAGP